MARYALCGSLTASTGNGDALAALLLEAADELAATPGCLLYLVNRIDDDPDTVWIIEVWADEGAHQASLELLPIRNIITRARPLLVGAGERFEMRSVGGHGL